MKILLYILIPAIFVFSCKKTDDNDKEFLISGLINGYPEGEIVLSKYHDGHLISLDSTNISKGEFNFKPIKLNSPELFYLIIDSDQIIIEFFMEQNDIQINADFLSGGSVEVYGSEIHNEYILFLENNLVFNNRQNEIYAQKEIALSNNDDRLFKELDSMYFNIYEEQINFIKSYINDNKESFVSVYIASRTLADELSLGELEKLSLNFSDTVKRSIYFQELKDEIEAKKRIRTGIQATDFSLTDTSGSSISLSSLQGKFVLLDFSASWHEQSRKRTRLLDQQYKQYKKFGFEIYQVDLERDMDEWKRYLIDERINWICVSDLKALDSEVAKLYNINNLPTSFLLDRRGMILYNDIEIESLDSILNDLF